MFQSAWWQKITEVFSQIFGAVTDIGIRDVIDILIVAYIVYKAIMLIKETRAQQLVKGIILLIAVYIISLVFNFKTLSYIMNNFLSIGVIALMIIFQPELRRILEKVGRSKITDFNVFAGGTQEEQAKEHEKIAAIDGICESVTAMSLQKTGALICIEQQTKLGDIINTGTVINADVTPELIGSIFFPNSPLHDGAMIIRDFKIHAAGCFLPLSQTNDINKQLGTRHRASLGMSENSDAVIIVVSEETGVISVAQNGKLTRNFDAVSLKSKLIRELMPDKNANLADKKSVFRKVIKNGENKKQ